MRRGGWYRSPCGQGSMHLLVGRGSLASQCAAPCLPGDDATQFGGVCARIAAHLCDAPVASGRTCDAAMCEQHRTNVGPDRDFCPRHANLAATQERLL